jgi:hypothetical protein
VHEVSDSFDDSTNVIGRHGRLSADYLKAALESTRPAPLPVVSPVDSPVARLSADYRDAVADLVSNPSAHVLLVLDERFSGDAPGWPNDPFGGARCAAQGYRLTARLEDHVLTVAAPVSAELRDVLVGATFRLLGGPEDGAFGLITRDRSIQSSGSSTQSDRYYVAQANARREVSIWRREQDHWVKLVPWTPCAALASGLAPNDLSFESVGARLTLLVNGQPAATANDAALDAGSVGLFVNGHGNDVLVDRFVVQVLS